MNEIYKRINDADLFFTAIFDHIYQGYD